MAADKQSNALQLVQAAFDPTAQGFKALLTGTSQITITADNTTTSTTGDTIRIYSALEPVNYDYVGYVLSGAGTIMTETYRNGGAAGTIVGTITKTYVDNTRTTFISVARS